MCPFSPSLTDPFTQEPHNYALDKTCCPSSNDMVLVLL